MSKSYFLITGVYIVIVLLIVFILSFISKGKEKKDKGFKFYYFRLSYRRKMIRTLIFLPVVILLFFILDMDFLTGLGTGTIVVFKLLLVITFLVQFTYNYIMWKKFET